LGLASPSTLLEDNMSNKKVIEVLTDEEIRLVYQNLWVVFRNAGLSRREFVDLMSKVPNDADERGIRVVWPGPEEQEYDFPDIDDLIDHEGKWFSNFVKRADQGYRPRSKSVKYCLLRLMVIFLEIHHPRIAQLVKKPLEEGNGK
jgi:hypothetical protein